MDEKSLRVVVVDDDFRIAKMHTRFIEAEMGTRLLPQHIIMNKPLP
jgi:response regulator of citrate/malate metabolism